MRVRWPAGRKESRRSPRTFARDLRFEPLEERRLLAIIADTFDSKFVQSSWISGQEVTVLTADAAGNSSLMYHPNDELGYVDPATGDLLFCDYYPGTSSVLVLTCAANGNLSDLTGFTYSNGQVITPDGGNTVYHRDGSLMRSGGVWTYDAGATLGSAGNYHWSNGTVMVSGATLNHANGALLRDASNTLYFAAGGTFVDPALGVAFYPGGQSYRNSAGDYFFQSSTPLLASEAIHYSNGTVMVDAAGDVFNATGTPSFKPFSRIENVGDTEYFTNVSNEKAEVIHSFAQDSGGSYSAYVNFFSVTYDELPPDPVDLNVTYIDDATLYFSWASGGGSTTGYRVAWADGVSAPGDVSGGVETADDYYVVSGLTPGQKVSLRVAAKDSDGDLSYGAIATGTAGQLVQTPQTHSLISNALAVTFAQVYDTFYQDIIFTIDKDGNSFVWYKPNEELGYINIDNGDRLAADFYQLPWTNVYATELSDARPFGNLAQIPDGARYQDGQLVRIGDAYYHENGAVLRSGSGTWFYPSGDTMQNSTTTFWPANITMRSGTTARYPNNAILKSGATISYQDGTPFTNDVTAQYPNSTNLKNSISNLFYETGATLYASNTFLYPAGATMINSAGDPFYSFGSPATLPFENFDIFGGSTAYTGINVDRIARSAVVVGTNNARHVLGGTVDYSTPSPPAPTNLQVQEQGIDYAIFNFASGGGSTADFVYAYSLGATAPYTPDGGTVVAGDTFTIEGLEPGQQVAVRLFARNSEGEFSPGITAVATAIAPPDLLGDYNGDQIVDAADYTVWRNTLGTTGLGPYDGADGSGNGEIGPEDYQIWKEHYGESLPGSGGGGLSRIGALQWVGNDVAASVVSVESSDSSTPVAGSQDVPLGMSAGGGMTMQDSRQTIAALLSRTRMVDHRLRDDALMAWIASRNWHGRLLRDEVWAADAVAREPGGYTDESLSSDELDAAFEVVALL